MCIHKENYIFKSGTRRFRKTKERGDTRETWDKVRKEEGIEEGENR